MDRRTALLTSPLPLLALLILTTSPYQAHGSGRTGGAAGVTCTAPTTAELAAAVSATNAVRAARGLSPVRGSAALSSAAASHACDMAQRGRLTHRGSRTAGPAQRVRGTGYEPVITAENIAAGPFEIAGVLAAWQGSGGHLANMLIPEVSDVGIGKAMAADGRTRFWSAVYAAPR